MDGVEYRKLTRPDSEIAAAFDRWENDPDLVPFIRPTKSKAEQEEIHKVNIESLTDRMKHTSFYLIYADGRLVGEVNYQEDPPHCMKQEKGTAWIAITIGEKSARHCGIGSDAMCFLEEETRRLGFRRIELGVFEFNSNARRLYSKSGYREIGRIENFTWWQGSLRTDIRMEKWLVTAPAQSKPDREGKTE